jgi:TPP-dependent pyruvate/acetoin dehydrogenase alpha subunit
MKTTKDYLIEFEEYVAKLFEDKKILYPCHLSGGNEDILIDIFKGIKKNDFVVSTHRNHYHALLKGIPVGQLIKNMTTTNEMGSMHTIDYKRHFFSSATVAGCVAIACGVALGLKLKGSKDKVFCFVGDGATDEGWFGEAVKYATTMDLPILYIVEYNNRSVCSSVKDRWGMDMAFPQNSKCRVYGYTPTYPHCSTGKYISF